MNGSVSFLDFVPLEVRDIQHMDEKSKACKKAVASLRSRFQSLLFSQLWQGNEEAAYYTKSYKRHFFQSMYCLAMAVLVIIFGFVLDPGGDENTFAPHEILALGVWMGLMALFLLLSLWCALRARKVMDSFLLDLVRRHPVRPAHFEDELFAQVVDAYIFSRNNKGSFTAEEQCGCYHCQEIFQGKMLEQERDDAALCPYCGQPAVLGKHRGYPIDKEFLNNVHEYWYSG